MFTLEQILSDHECGHSQFQIDNFITSKGGATTYGKYKQALTELYSRFNSLKVSICERLEKDLTENAFSIDDDSSDDIERKVAKIQHIKFKLEQEGDRRAIEGQKREFNRFYQHACALKKMLEDKHGPLTDEVKKTLEHEYWETKLKQTLATQLELTGRPNESLYEAILALPKDMKYRILDELSHPDRLVEWHTQHSDEDNLPLDLISEVKPLDFIEDFEKKLLGE